MWTFVLHGIKSFIRSGDTYFFIPEFKHYKGVWLNVIFKFSFVFKYFYPMVTQVKNIGILYKVTHGKYSFFAIYKFGGNNGS